MVLEKEAIKLSFKIDEVKQRPGPANVQKALHIFFPKYVRDFFPL